MNDFVNGTVRDLKDLRARLVFDEDACGGPHLEAIDNALAVLSSLTFHAVFPAQRKTCESISEHAENRFGWK